MVVNNLICLYILLISYIVKYVYSVPLTLDLDVKETNDKVDVLRTEHYGLSSLEYYPKDGYTIKKVVQGELFVWKGEQNDHCNNAILYSPSGPLSLLYLNVYVKNNNLYKYYVNVGGQWREVLENTFKLFVDIDRTSYTYEELNKFAFELLKHSSYDIDRINSFYRNSYTFYIKPIHVCDLEISKPDTNYIMKQYYIGKLFGIIYTPRSDYGINYITYNGIKLWSRPNRGRLCSSVCRYIKSNFDELILITLNDVQNRNNRNPYLCFVKNNNDGITRITLERFQKLYIKMKNADYNKNDIELYKYGYLNVKDIAIIFKPILAIFIISSVVLYSL